MTLPLRGVRVIELASWLYIPSAGCALADWGADVIKVEHPVAGEPTRGTRVGALDPNDAEDQFSLLYELSNRGKRSIGLDLKSESGRALLHRLVAGSDVFLTNWRGGAARRAGVDPDQIHSINPRIIYARGTGQGPQGPDRDAPGFDATSFWARGALAYALTPAGQSRPPYLRPALGDLTAGIITAGGIAAALVHRHQTGEGSVVDTSLLATAAWVLSPDVVAASRYQVDKIPGVGEPRNPIATNYETKDHRHIALMMLESDRYWTHFCAVVGREDLAVDPRFVDSAARSLHAEECIAALADLFRCRTLAEWTSVLAELDGAWAAFQSPQELLDDTQVEANEFIVEVDSAAGTTYRTAVAPVRFDGASTRPCRAPEFCEHTEEILLEAGLTWDDIAQADAAGAFGRRASSQP